jgi:hypothetical protein
MGTLLAGVAHCEDIDAVSSFWRSSVQVSLVPGRPESLRCQKVTLLLLFRVGSTKGRLAAEGGRPLEPHGMPLSRVVKKSLMLLSAEL